MEDGQRASWETISCLMAQDSNPLAVSRFTDNPNSTARLNWRSRWESNPHLPNVSGHSIAVELRVNPQPEQNYLLRLRTRSCAEGNQRSRFGKGRWTSDVIERRHYMLGIEPRALGLPLKTLRPPILAEDNRSTSAHLNWGDQPDSHRHKRLHGA